MADDDETETQPDDEASEAEENRRRSEAMVNAQLTNPNPSR